MAGELLFSKQLLDSLGILEWGYTEESSPRTFDNFKTWAATDAGPLTYLTDHRLGLREDIKNIYPEFESALVFLFSYHNEKKFLLENNSFEVAGYAMGFNGEDYHYEIGRRLKILFESLNLSEVDFKISLDIQPILERDLAYRAGLGWFGKNSMLISRDHGSYFLIGSLLLSKKLAIQNTQVSADHCGKCTLCIDACPTDAINIETRTIKASLCLSTFTIEVMKEASAPPGYEKSRGELFGCDICQDVCPWNKKVLRLKDFSAPLSEQSQKLITWLQQDPNVIIKQLEVMSKRGVKKFFEGTVFERPGKIGWIKNFKAKLRIKP